MTADSETTPSGHTFTRAETDRMRQWFDALQDVSPAYLELGDFVLAKRLYDAVEMRVPHSVASKVPKP